MKRLGRHERQLRSPMVHFEAIRRVVDPREAKVLSQALEVRGGYFDEVALRKNA